MSFQKSYDSVSNKFWDEFKAKLSRAEGPHDVKSIFSQKMVKLINTINVEFDVVDGDVTLVAKDDTYKLSEKLAGNAEFKELCETSDLPAIMNKYAEQAAHKCKHLEHNGKETNGKKVIH